MIGYEVSVRFPNGSVHVFCADERLNILSYCPVENEHYFSHWERWHNPTPFGTLSGELDTDALVSAIHPNGSVITVNGVPVRDVPVLETLVVDVAEKTKDPYIAGVHRPVQRPMVAVDSRGRIHLQRSDN